MGLLMATIEHYGSWSVLPPLISVLLAMLTRRIIFSLFAGVFAACLILSSGNPLKAVVRCISEDLFNSLIKVEHLQVFAFTLLVGGMVGIIHSSGGMRSLVLLLEPFASDRRRGQLVTWLAGLVIFFDDYANTLLLGTTFQPVTDRLKISREKLAYIVDSTAAPVAGLALISTWVAGEVNFIGTGLQQINVHDSGGLAFLIFVKTILYRFYPLLALILVGIVAYSGKDFGPMWKAEKEAFQGNRESDQSVAKNISSTMAASEQHSGGNDRVVLPLASIGILLFVLVLTLIITGLLESKKHSSWWEVVGAGDAYGSLVWASLAGCLTAAFLSWLGNNGTVSKIFSWAWRGFKMMSAALVILWLAWTLADLTSPGDFGERLGTSIYLASLLGDSVAPAWLPTLVFLLASVVAYCTGTSWGTMSILVPLVISLTWKILGGSGDEILHTPIFSATVGGVLAGSIFGDHCSPLSDTTILSSRASGCDHMAHVWTQAPYALLAAFVSVVAGTIPIGFGIPIWVVLPVAIGSLWLAHNLISSPITSEPNRAASDS